MPIVLQAGEMLCWAKRRRRLERDMQVSALQVARQGCGKREGVGYRMITSACRAVDGFGRVGARVAARCGCPLTQRNVGAISCLHAEETNLQIRSASLNPDIANASWYALVSGDGGHLSVGLDFISHVDLHGSLATSRIEMVGQGV